VVCAAIRVTNPQDLSALVIKKAIHMVQLMNFSILGIVENISYYPCPHTGSRHGRNADRSENFHHLADRRALRSGHTDFTAASLN